MGNKHGKKNVEENKSEKGGGNADQAKATTTTSNAGNQAQRNGAAAVENPSDAKEKVGDGDGNHPVHERKWSVLKDAERKLTDDYMLGKKLGEGSYGKVRIAKNRHTGHHCAVKCVLKKNMRRLHTLRREIGIMRSIDHPNIIKMLDVYEDEAFLYIVMELCNGGELFDRIIAAGHYTEADAVGLVRQILESVAYLHSQYISHRDLKPENFLFESKQPNAPLKLIDFGLSRFYRENIFMQTRVGTPYYVAPEVLKKQYDKACDIWSVGVIMYILLAGYPPFYGQSEREIYKMVREGKFDFPEAEWGNVSPQAKDLIHLMLDINPNTRITAKDALQHPWFKMHEPNTETNAGGVSIPVVDSSVPVNVEQPQQKSPIMYQSSHSPPIIPSEDKLVGKGETVIIEESSSSSSSSSASGSDCPASDQQKQQAFTPDVVKGEEERIPQKHRLSSASNSDFTGVAPRELDPIVLERIKKFAKSNRLKRAALGIIVRYLTRKEIQELRQQFKAIDNDGNGVVSVSELANAMRNTGLNPSNQEVESLLKALDEDGNGLVDYEEFLVASLDRHVYLRDELLESAFHYFDTEGTGVITKQDLEARLGHEDPQLVQSILKSVDLDHDGSIDLAEFKDMMARNT